VALALGTTTRVTAQKPKDSLLWEAAARLVSHLAVTVRHDSNRAHRHLHCRLLLLLLLLL
jgi:hypothetical protein